MKMTFATFLAVVVTVVCATEAKGYSLADEQARASPDWFRKNVIGTGRDRPRECLVKRAFACFGGA